MNRYSPLLLVLVCIVLPLNACGSKTHFRTTSIHGREVNVVAKETWSTALGTAYTKMLAQPSSNSSDSLRMLDALIMTQHQLEALARNTDKVSSQTLQDCLQARAAALKKFYANPEFDFIRHYPPSTPPSTRKDKQIIGIFSPEVPLLLPKTPPLPKESLPKTITIYLDT